MPTYRRLRSYAFWVVFPVCASAGTSTIDSVQTFFTKNCYACHNAKTASGKLNLEDYKTAASVVEQRERWEHIARKLETGEMPPKGFPRPDQADVKDVLAWIHGEFDKADALVKPEPGHVTARRLNRAEYNNTVRDLLGVDLHPADNFPQDDSGYGFDNIGDVLSLSPVLMERYLGAAEKVTRAALFGPEIMKPAIVRFQPPFRRRADGTAGGSYSGPSWFTITNYDFSGLTMPSALHTTYRFPVDAEYLFRATPAGQRPGGSEPIKLAIWVDGKMVASTDVHPLEENGPTDDISGQTREFRARVSAGEHWVAVTFIRQFDGLPGSYGGLNPSKRPPPPAPDLSFLKPPAGATPEQVEKFKKRAENFRSRKLDVNNIRIDNLEIGGPYQQTKGPSPESLKKIYVCGHLNGHHQPGCERKILTAFARRTYRRPPTDAEVKKLMSLATLARKHRDSFEEGLAVAIEGALVEPQFLFRIEQPGNLNDFELASRLSYFLWRTEPDEELLRTAEHHSLHQSEVLEAQVRRMLKDPKSHALSEEFGGQWLEFRGLESVHPDRDKFPDFEDYLRMSMRTESEMFFDSIVREDRSILDFLDAKYSFLNERLAELYNIQGIQGPEFRRVDLSGHPERGGILSQASVLTVSSYATRTSPVLRGKWILENILNAPPPPPPPNVPTLDETAVGTSGSLRQQLEKHRSNAVCASCHSRMDPLGFSLENYDAIGSWRTKDGKFPIDASGTLPDGRNFEGLPGLKKILLADHDQFAACVTEKLLTFALGRGLERYDRPTLKTIVKNVGEQDYRFSSLVLEIVKSLPFQMQKGDRGKT